MPKFSLSTLLSSLLYLLPAYFFVLAPLLRQLFPDPSAGNLFDVDLDADGTEPDSGLTLNPEILSLPDGVIPNCAPDNYRVHLLQKDPLVIYIEDFLSAEETDHIVNLSKSNYTLSTIYNGHNTTHDATRRLSDRALLPRDNTVRCLEARAAAFQGWKPHLYIERMWAQRYNTSGHYVHHYDWAGSAARGGDRLSTFMVYLGDDCDGGGTNFPRLSMPRGAAALREWCRFLACPADDAAAAPPGGELKDGESSHVAAAAAAASQGVTFKPIKGNAIFWENLRPDGSGYPETWHAAFPVTSGTKIGLNIWSWYQPPRRRRG
ncbi:oxidoreductase [Aspergillus indologenus CBS 114.80]|uniref:Oxidoreductase n=1 Tax=Aspergillus indologenus CBS 114.80 TaxID=1450541 RepID=A0A2V5IW45_9EURO|nr:oxidoreductase [Aspergillus indologenus CBS 114.80]